MSGSGSAKLGKDGKLHGRIKLKDGDASTFIAVRALEPAVPIPAPPELPGQVGAETALVILPHHLVRAVLSQASHAKARTRSTVDLPPRVR